MDDKGKSEFNLDNLKRGLSGCLISVDKDGSIKKQSPTISYNERLRSQAVKQNLFSSYFFKNIYTPNILREEYQNNLFTFNMEYISAESDLNFFSHASVDDVVMVSLVLHEYLGKLSKTSVEFDFTDEIYKKLNSLKKSSSYQNIIINIENHINQRGFILPRSICHGDLTLANILFHKDRLCFIDFLDSYIDSYLCDLVKLRQDLFYFWNLKINSCNDLRHRIIYKELWSRISVDYKDYLNSIEFTILDTLNYLRIEPYLNNEYHTKQ